MESTSDGKSVIYDGIFFPVKNWAVSPLKVLQLCSKRWYVSGLHRKMKENIALIHAYLPFHFAHRSFVHEHIL